MIVRGEGERGEPRSRRVGYLLDGAERPTGGTLLEAPFTGAAADGQDDAVGTARLRADVPFTPELCGGGVHSELARRMTLPGDIPGSSDRARIGEPFAEARANDAADLRKQVQAISPFGSRYQIAALALLQHRPEGGCHLCRVIKFAAAPP